VRNATFISNDQLFRSVHAIGLGMARNTLNWRLRRFVTHGLVRQLAPVLPYRGYVYAITHAGLRVLESYGEGLISITSASENLADDVQAPHFLELNEIYLTLFGTGRLRHWLGDREVRSLNYTVAEPYTKDYDAIFEMDWNGKLQVGLEHERSFKAAEKYAGIATAMNRERKLNMVLYVTPVYEMGFKLATALNGLTMPTCFTSASHFRAKVFDAQVICSDGKVRLFKEFVALLTRAKA
jgi:hypothetical protein